MKDTAKNVTDTGECVVNIMSEWYVEAANHTCGDFPPEVDEMEAAGLTKVPSVTVKPPRVGEAAVQIECKVVHSYDLKNSEGAVTFNMFVVEVVLFHVHEHVLDNTKPERPRVRLEDFRPVSRLGGNTYGLTTRVFDLLRPKITPAPTGSDRG